MKGARNSPGGVGGERCQGRLPTRIFRETLFCTRLITFYLSLIPTTRIEGPVDRDAPWEINVAQSKLSMKSKNFHSFWPQSTASQSNINEIGGFNDLCVGVCKLFCFNEST